MNNSRKIGIFVFIIILIGGGTFPHFLKILKSLTKENYQLKLNLSKTMKLTSPAFEDNKFIPSKYTCDGEDINPPLDIEEVSPGVESLVLIVDDPDAPMGNWNHWIVWNIDPKTMEIRENEVPEGAIEGMNDFGRHSYGGPCPPSGVHHYHFKLYALSKKLDIDSSSKKRDVEAVMEGSIFSKAELIGLYERK